MFDIVLQYAHPYLEELCINLFSNIDNLNTFRKLNVIIIYLKRKQMYSGIVRCLFDNINFHKDE